jgi:hypothetical protein
MVDVVSDVAAAATAAEVGPLLNVRLYILWLAAIISTSGNRWPRATVAMAATVVVFVRIAAAVHAIFRSGEESGIDDEPVVVRRAVFVAAQKARRPNMIFNFIWLVH